MRSATGETHVPTNVSAADALPLYTTITASGTPVVVRNVNDAGVDNKLGNRRFLRFTPTITGPVTMTLTFVEPEQCRPGFPVQRSGTYRAHRRRPAAAAGDRHRLGDRRHHLRARRLRLRQRLRPRMQGDGSGDYDLTVTIN